MDFNSWLRRFTEWWNALVPLRRAAVIAGVATVIALLFFLGQWRSKANYYPVFTQLDLKEAGQITDKLKEMRVSYRLANEGTTILVPKNEVYDLRLELAKTGLLTGSGVGFEIFDQTQLGMSEAQWQVNYQRALQEELRRTIICYAEIKEARVHLVIPKPSVFVEEKGSPTAAVMLELKPLASLTTDQVKSIMSLVASSVEGMALEDVRVVDAAGRLLSDQVQTGTSTLYTTVQQDLKRNFERDLEKRVTVMLERILGPGNAVVMIAANLDFSQYEQTRTEYGNEGIIRSERVIEEQSTGTGGNQAPVGDLNRQPPTYQVADSQEGTGFNRVDTTRNYEVSETQEKTIYAPGRVVGLSTAVTVNGDLPPNTVAQIREIVATATAYQPQRGDQIAVVGMAFDRSLAAEEEARLAAAAQEEQARARMLRYFVWSFMGLAILAGIIGGMIWLLRRRPVPVPDELATEVAATFVEDIIPEEIPVIEEKQPPEEEELVVKKMLAEEEKEVNSKQGKIREMVKKQPEEAAALIKAWLAEE